MILKYCFLEAKKNTSTVKYVIFQNEKKNAKKDRKHDELCIFSEKLSEYANLYGKQITFELARTIPQTRFV